MFVQKDPGIIILFHKPCYLNFSFNVYDWNTQKKIHLKIEKRKNKKFILAVLSITVDTLNGRELKVMCFGSEAGKPIRSYSVHKRYECETMRSFLLSYYTQKNNFPYLSYHVTMNLCRIDI